MKGTFWQSLIGDGLAAYRDEVNRENRLAVKIVSIWGLPLGFASALAQSIFLPGPETFVISLRSCWLFVYFIFLFALERLVIPKDYPHSVFLVYAIEAPIMAMSIMLGSFWDPEHQAITFFVFLMALPVFILDRPIRIGSVYTVWTVLFILACAATKSPEVLQRDILHAVEFYLASMAVTSMVVRLRQVSLERMGRIRYLLEHDELTGARNDKSLERHEKDYIGKPLMVLLADLDQLKLFNDFYGHAFGNRVLVKFVDIMTETFGSDWTYRYRGDAMLCIADNSSEQDWDAILDECREKLLRNGIEGHVVDLNCAFGYVTGTPTTVDELKDMVQLANIYAHRAKSSGQGQTIGGAFDEERLQHGIVESITGTHAQAYETNRLTGLPSISYFLERIDDIVTTLVDMSRHPVVGYFKLSHMREFNDEHGYSQGDALIEHTAQLLGEAFSQRHICSIAGAEFAVLCYLDEVESAMNLIDAGLKRYDDDFTVSCKAGFAEFDSGESVIGLLDKARVAHRSLKDQDGALFRVYDESLDEEIKFKQYIVAHVDEAIENGYLQVFYQPIVRSVTGEVCNEEALSRWNDPVYGFLPPFRFIPPLEESKQIYKLSLNVVRQVVRDFKRKQELGVPIVPVSVNLSRYDFEQCDMVREVSAIIDESGFSRSMIMIEITESAFIKNQEFLKREVERFRQSGFQVWMDDFGSEYSTLNLLQELDFDLIKIDMQFMKNFSESNRNLIIVSDIIDMAKRMGMVTLIEGIETEEHFQALRDLGCNKLQGYLFDKPNNLDYVIEQATVCKTLSFEKPQEAPYYTAIGRIDLNAPFGSDGSDGDLGLSGQIPVGIIEQTREGFFCLLGNDRFYQYTQSRVNVSRGLNRIAVSIPPENLPAGLIKAIADCSDVDGWVDVELEDDGHRKSNAYLRSISKNAFNGNAAFLLVLLSADKAFSGMA